MNVSKKIRCFFMVSVYFLCGCSAFSKEKIPYVVDAEIEMDCDAEEYDIAGLKLFFYNKEDKNIKEITVVFYIFDEDGEPVSIGRNNAVMCIQKEIAADSSVEIILSLDQYFSEFPDESYTVDFIYVSKILYEDSSVWMDPYGIAVF